MMLAYQPVRSLATVNITIQQGLAGAKVLPIIDQKPEIRDKGDVKNLRYENGEIVFENVNFDYSEDDKIKINQSKISRKKMTALVGQSGAGE